MADAEGIALSLEKLERSAPVIAQKRFEGRLKSQAKRAVAGQLGDLITIEVFDRAQTPAGDPWLRLSDLTNLLYSEMGARPGLPGQGIGDNALRDSFELDGPDNIFEETEDGLIFGSGLTRNGVSVVVGFQETYAVPSAPQTVEADNIRKFMLAVVGIPAPGDGKVLAHPGRRVLDLPPVWMEQLLLTYLEFMEEAMMATAEDSLRAADAEITMARERSGGLAQAGDFSAARREGRGGALQLF